MTKWRMKLIAAMLAFAASWTSTHAQELKVGVVGTTSDASFFIADAKGYFKAEGLTVSFIRFDSAAKMIVPLGSGELDAGGGATSSALYNAAKRDVNIKIVGDGAVCALIWVIRSLWLGRSVCTPFCPRPARPIPKS